MVTGHAHWLITVDHFTTLTCMISTMATRSANETCSPAMKGLSWMNFSSMSFRETFRSSKAASSLSWGTSTPRTLGIKSYSTNIENNVSSSGRADEITHFSTTTLFLTQNVICISGCDDNRYKKWEDVMGNVFPERWPKKPEKNAAYNLVNGHNSMRKTKFTGFNFCASLCFEGEG